MTETVKDNKRYNSAAGEPTAEKKENISTSIQKIKEHIKLSDIMGGKILIRKFSLIGKFKKVVNIVSICL
jgi:hypothetical protein